MTRRKRWEIDRELFIDALNGLQDSFLEGRDTLAGIFRTYVLVAYQIGKIDGRQELIRDQKKMREYQESKGYITRRN